MISVCSETMSLVGTCVLIGAREGAASVSSFSVDRRGIFHFKVFVSVASC